MWDCVCSQICTGTPFRYCTYVEAPATRREGHSQKPGKLAAPFLFVSTADDSAPHKERRGERKRRVRGEERADN